MRLDWTTGHPWLVRGKRSQGSHQLHASTFTWVPRAEWFVLICHCFELTGQSRIVNHCHVEPNLMRLWHQTSISTGSHLGFQYAAYSLPPCQRRGLLLDLLRRLSSTQISNVSKCPNVPRSGSSIWQNHMYAGRGGKEARAAEKVLYAMARVSFAGFPHVDVKIAKHRFLYWSYLDLDIKVTSLNFSVPSVIHTTAASVIVCLKQTVISLSSPPELVIYSTVPWNKKDNHQKKGTWQILVSWCLASHWKICGSARDLEALRRWHAHGTAAGGWDPWTAHTGTCISCIVIIVGQLQYLHC